MNRIVNMQNNEKYLKIQYSARTYYRYAERLSVFAWILAYINICMGMLIRDDLLLRILAAICMVLVFVVQDMVDKRTKYAAAFQMYFDYKMFGWKSNLYHKVSERKLWKKSERIIHFRKKDSQIRMRNNGEQKPRGVRKRYSNIELIPEGNQLINECQKQNIWCNNKVLLIQKILFNFILIVTFALILIIPNYVKFSDFNRMYLLSITLFSNLITETHRTQRHIDLVHEFEDHNKSIQNNNLTIDDVKELQELIDKRRNIPKPILNIVHDRWLALRHQ